MSDTKHGWVTSRADGVRARCGGPGACPTCDTEAMHEKMLTGLFGAPTVVGAAAAPDKAPLTSAAARLSAMANEAREQYQTELAAGGEPKWPAWVDDLALVLHPAPAAGDARKELTPEQIEAGWHQTFSTSNPYCPCNLKSFTKAVRWAECAIAAQQGKGGEA